MDVFARYPVAPLLDVQFDDVDAMRSIVTQWDLDFQPIQRAAPDHPVARVAQFASGVAEFSYGRFFVNIDQRGAAPPDRVTFCVFGRCLKRLWWMNHDVTCDDVAVYPVGGELRSISGSDFEVFTISITEPALEEVCSEMRLSLPPRRFRRDVFRLTAQMADLLRSKLRGLRDSPLAMTIGQTRDIVALLAAAWCAPEDATNVSRPSIRARDLAIKRALDYASYEDADRLSIDALCSVANASERTLQYAFRERFGLTPAAFLKAVRLVEARRRLIAHGPSSATVGQILVDHGFGHRGRFASDYRTAFGESPSDTLASAA